MSKTFHFICQVEDSINDYKVVASIYCDVSTTSKASKYFLKHKELQKYFGNLRYQITFRQNSVVLQYPE